MEERLYDAARRAIAYRKAARDEPIPADPSADLSALSGRFPEGPTDPGEAVLRAAAG